MAHCMKVAQKLANKIVENMHAKGCNILTNAKEVSGQTVHHFHIHIIPRYEENDPIKIEFTDRSSVVNLDDIYNEIMKQKNRDLKKSLFFSTHNDMTSLYIMM